MLGWREKYTPGMLYLVVRASAKAARSAWHFTLLIAGALAAEPVARPTATNGKIAFTSDRDGDLEIYVMNEDGTEQTRLTNNPGVDCFPAFSPGGTKIAFVGLTAKGTFAIKMMNADGTNPTEITPIDFKPSLYPWHETASLSWSPDGAKIAFEEAGDIFTIKIDGTERRNLTNDPALDCEPAWSPDGTRILFVSSRAYWRTMHVMNADGSDVRELPSAGEYWDTSPDYSPSGAKIVFVVRSEMLLPILYTANADGSERWALDGCEAGLCSTHRNKPRWSPDGKKIVFHVWEYFSNDAQIYAKSIDGGGTTQLTRGGGRNFQPAWQPVVAGP